MLRGSSHAWTTRVRLVVCTPKPKQHGWSSRLINVCLSVQLVMCYSWSQYNKKSLLLPVPHVCFFTHFLSYTIHQLLTQLSTSRPAWRPIQIGKRKSRGKILHLHYLTGRRRYCRYTCLSSLTRSRSLYSTPLPACCRQWGWVKWARRVGVKISNERMLRTINISKFKNYQC